MQLRLTMFKMGLICYLFFDARSFVSQYIRRYGPLDRDPGPREKRALIMFRDEGIPAYDFSGSPPYIPIPKKIKEFTSFPPLPDPSRPGGQLVLTFEFVAYLIQQGRPVLGCFPVRLDVDKQGLTEFDKLGDKIYDYWSPTLPYNPDLQSATHLVTFVDYGKADDRPFLKFVNTHDRSWGADGFGKIFFSSVYQKDDTFCFHILSFDDPLPSSSSPPSPTAVSDRFMLPPPPTVQPPFRCWHGIQITEPIYEAAQVRTVQVTEISPSATVQDRKELFSISGDTRHVDMQSHDEVSQDAFVTSKYAQGVDTLHLPSGARIADLSVIIKPPPERQLHPTASPPGSTLLDLSVTIQPAPEHEPPPTSSAPLMIGEDNVVEDIVSTVIAKVGKNAAGKAKSSDEKHGGFTSTAGAKVPAIDKKIVQITLGNDKAREIDQKLQVSDKTKSACIVCCRAAPGLL